MEMTPRARWFALMAGERPDRIPTDYQATPEVTARLLRELDCANVESLYRRLRIDARRFITAAPLRTHHPDDAEADIWGVRYRKADYGSGTYDEPVFHPLAHAASPREVDAWRWPDASDFDYSVITRFLDADDGFRPIHCGCFEPFLLYGYLRGLERSFEDLALRPDLALAILGRIFAFHFEHLRRSFEAGGGRIDLTWVAEDLGAQTGPLMSLATYRRFLLPHQIQIADLARSFGIHVMYHSDGAARPFLPDLVNRVGIEFLNPIQWRCPGMDRASLVADFGDRIIFHGSIDNQWTLPFGSPDDVRSEVRESIRIYEPARWICNPCHNLQPVTPTENIVAMYEAIDAWG
ncbi:MAG: uroporphyrinogen-III decarboxylase-like protein [Planctomycetes bacterium]|nr:uroporphyrinogen-III decarboxylase-like protein [Planctomycetota bacterium]